MVKSIIREGDSLEIKQGQFTQDFRIRFARRNPFTPARLKLLEYSSNLHGFAGPIYSNAVRGLYPEGGATSSHPLGTGQGVRSQPETQPPSTSHD